MINSMKFLALALALGTAQFASAGSTTFDLSGNSCVSTTAGVPAIATRYGIYNASVGPLHVACPIQVPYAKYTQGYIGISGYNRNQYDPLSCSLSMSTDDGGYASGGAATIVNASPYVQYASRSMVPSVASEVVWADCHIPGAVSGSYSYLTSILITVNY